ncbi:hypothetical protein [Amycolatopsis anabasis]|uniref:hypothetical protein n=1 Tax=Amycolatopsis anabasis TaxID=1840409 RepID=UPI00131C4066|nr:hypothetical protein [Amycolatopsis anabasis]
MVAITDHVLDAIAAHPDIARVDVALDIAVRAYPLYTTDDRCTWKALMAASRVLDAEYDQYPPHIKALSLPIVRYMLFIGECANADAATRARYATYPAERLYEAPDLTGTGYSYDSRFVACHGPYREYVYPGRRVVKIPGREWPAAMPEACTDTSNRGEWLNDDILICPGCGVDCT